MVAQVHAESVEGNDVWFVWRVELPDGDTLALTDLTSTQITVNLIHESSMTNSKKVVLVHSGNGASGNGIVYNTLQTDGYWGGLDGDGYNVRVRIAAASTGAWILEGGNTYAIEVILKTSSFGNIHVAASLYVDHLHSA